MAKQPGLTPRCHGAPLALVDASLKTESLRRPLPRAGPFPFVFAKGPHQPHRVNRKRQPIYRFPAIGRFTSAVSGSILSPSSFRIAISFRTVSDSSKTPLVASREVCAGTKTSWSRETCGTETKAHYRFFRHIASLTVAVLLWRITVATAYATGVR